MTRDELRENYPKLYNYYTLMADREGLMEEVLRTFEATPLPKVSEYRVENALVSAMFEWDI